MVHRGVSGMQLVIHDDAVVVVDDLPLVAELDGFPEPAFRDRAGIAVVQTDHPGGSAGGGACWVWWGLVCARILAPFLFCGAMSTSVW